MLTLSGTSGGRYDAFMASRLSRYPRPLRLLVISTVLMVSGFSLLWPLVTIYVHTELHRSMAIAGVILLIQSAANLLGNLVGGHLFDAWNGRRTIVLGSCTATLAAVLMAVFHGIGPYVLLTVVLGLGTGAIYPSVTAFAATVWPEGRRAAFNAIYVANNVGVAIGSFLGGALAQVSFSLSFLTAGVVFAAYGLVALLLFRGPGWQQPLPDRRTAPTEAPRGSPALGAAPLLLAVGLLLDWAAYVQWQTSVPVHMQSLGFSLSSYSLLWTLNGAVILLGQPIISWLVARVPRVKAQILIGNSLFVAAFLLLTENRAYGGFLLTMLVATFGEMLVWPGVPSAADRLAPEGRRGLYQGVTNGAASGGRMLGPLLGGLLYDRYPSDILFGVMVGVFVLAMAIYAIYDRSAKGTGRQATLNA